MKIILSIVFSCCLVNLAHAQSPNQLQYQAIIRNASGAVVSNQAVGMRVSLLKSSASGTVVYAETHRDTTTTNGLVTVEIGAGTVVSGSFASVNWGQGPYFIKTETDITGGTNYQLISTTQLLSVPYALYAQSSSLKYSAAGDTLFSGKEYVIVPGISSANGSAVIAGSPGVTTSVASSVTTVSASIGGEVISVGASAVTSRGICYGTSANPTITNSTVASGSGLGSFTINIPGLNPATTYYARAYATNASGTAYGNQVIFATLGAAGQACAQGSTMTVTHTAGDVAPVTKTVTYKLVQTDITGESKCWIAQNLGADRQALSYDDHTEASAGWLWQFNQKQGYKHDGLITRTPNTTWITGINENSSWVQANDPCFLLLGSGWRIPVNLEWNKAVVNGKFGGEYNYFKSEMRLHHAGYFYFVAGEILSRGVVGFYWSANQTTPGGAFAQQLQDGGQGFVGVEKARGSSIRCIKD